MKRFLLTAVAVLGFASMANAQFFELNTEIASYEFVDIFCWVGDDTGAQLDVDADWDRDPNSGTNGNVGSDFASVANVTASGNGGDEISKCTSAKATAATSDISDTCDASTYWAFNVDTKSADHEAEQQFEAEIDNQASCRYTSGNATEVLRFKMTFTLKRPDTSVIDTYNHKFIGQIGPYNIATAQYEKANDRWKIYGHKMSSTGTGLPTSFTDYVTPNSSGSAPKVYTMYREQSKDQYEDLRTTVLGKGSNYIRLLTDNVNDQESQSGMVNKVEIKFEGFE